MRTVPNDALINALRSQGFKFKKQHPRVNAWKEVGGTKRILVRRNSKHTTDYATTILRQAGMKDAEIAAFISSVNN